MGNVLISNAAVLGFRSTTYNLGNDLNGTILVNLSLGDVHYGTLGGNIQLTFGNWAPTGTLSKVELQLSMPTTALANNTMYSISFPAEVIVSSDNFGTSLLNNFADANGAVLTFPHDCTQLNLECYSTDCGNSIYITPINRPYQSVQIQSRTPPSTGQIGDMSGTVCVDPASAQLVVTGANTNPYFVTSNTANLYSGLPVVFTGTSLESNVVVGNTYYIRNVVSDTTFTLSSTIGGSNIAVASNTTGNTMLLNSVQYVYVAAADYSANAYNRNIVSITAPNVITVNSNVVGISPNNPIMFTGNSSGNTGNLKTNTVYYIKTVGGSGNANITVSQTRNNGVAGPEVNTLTSVGSGNVNIDYTVYVGRDIFRRIPLQPF
jgi:hypothetical protein